MSFQPSLDRFKCSVCLDLFENPVITSCEHTFCALCLDTSVQTTGSNICPMCRVKFESKEPDSGMKRAMKRIMTKCQKCSISISVALLKEHLKGCGLGATGYTPAAGPSSGSARNMYTFQCPYCEQRHLDNQELIKHVNEQHKSETTKVVCPICKAMPWGNPEQTSTDFVQHVNLRHRFEYDRFVDFSVDEEKAYNMAVARSAQEF